MIVNKRDNYSLKKIINMKTKTICTVLVLVFLLTFFPNSNVCAWSAPVNVTINRLSMMTGFHSATGNSLPTGQYQITGTGEITYCVDQEGFGPGSGTAYALYDSEINTSYRDGITAILLRGYPNYTNGLTNLQAQYSTAMAIHFWERVCFGNSEGYSATGVTASSGYENALLWSLQLLNFAQNQFVPVLFAEFAQATEWKNNGGVFQCKVMILAHDTDSWILSMPEGVTVNENTTLSGSGDTLATMTLNNPSTFMGSNRQIYLQGYGSKGHGNIHYYVSGGFQTLVAVSREVITDGDPDYLELDDATTTVTLTKLGSDTQAGVSGAHFKVWSNADETVLVGEGDTNESGELIFSDIIFGTYYWRETTAPAGYVIDPAQYSFIADAGGVSGVTTLTNIPTTTTLYKIDADTSAALDGAHYIIRNSADAVVAQGDTGTSGQVRFQKLPIGSYTFTESKAPVGYLILKGTHSFVIQSDGSVTGETVLSDTRQQIQFTLTKSKGNAVWNDDIKSYEWGIVPAEGITFAVFAAADIRNREGLVIYYKDELVDTITTNAQGIAATTADLYYGPYYARETDGTSDIILDTETIYPITTEQQDQTTQTAIFELNDGQPIINRKIAGTLDVFKVAADTNLPMEGVVFEIYDKDDQLVDTLTTNEKGHEMTKVLPYGDYYLTETHTIDGYELALKQGFSINNVPEKGESISREELTIVDQKTPPASTPAPTSPPPSPQTSPPAEVLGVYREIIAKTGEENDIKKEAAVVLLLIIPVIWFVLLRRRHFDEGK